MSVGRIVRSADFVRVLKTPIRARSPHFAIHHLAAPPSHPAKPPASPAPSAVEAELSTGQALHSSQPVDDLPLEGIWLGAVVPKRNAKRAVTRTMIKRQIKSAMASVVDRIDQGLWVVRLRAPFDKGAFPSATSAALVKAVRDELQAVFAHAERAAHAARPRSVR